MAGPLVPSSNPFQQQGQVDWVALSSSTASFSVAALARLAKAGVDPLTIHVGKALCHNFQLGPVAQDAMVEAIGKLKKYGFCSDVLWFGFGIKQTLVDLSETEQGLALVALCSTLQTMYDDIYSAQVLRQLCLQAGAPRAFTPSLMQWRGLLGMCAGVLIKTPFELAVLQLSNLIMGSRAGSKNTVSSPASIVDVLIALSKLQEGRFDRLTIKDRASCAWLAVFAERILSLNVRILAGSVLLYRSRCRNEHDVQVTFEVSNDDSTVAEIVDRTVALPVNHKRIVMKMQGDLFDHITLRSTWSSLLHDAFGSKIENILHCSSPTCLMRLLLRYIDGQVPETYIRYFGHFEEFSNQISFWHRLRNRSASEALDQARKLPELHKSIENHQSTCSKQSHVEQDDLTYWKSWNFGRSSAGSARYEKANEEFWMALAILYFLQILYVSDVDEDVQPSSLGLYNLFRSMQKADKGAERISLSFANVIDKSFEVFTRNSVTRRSGSGRYAGLIGPAIAGDGICVYRNGISNPTLSIEFAERLRVVKGHISYDDRCYDMINDMEPWAHDVLEFYQDNLDVERHQLEDPFGQHHMLALLKISDNSRTLDLGFRVDPVELHALHRTLELHLERMFYHCLRKEMSFETACDICCVTKDVPNAKILGSCIPEGTSVHREDIVCPNEEQIKQLLSIFFKAENIADLWMFIQFHDDGEHVEVLLCQLHVGYAFTSGLVGELMCAPVSRITPTMSALDLVLHNINRYFRRKFENERTIPTGGTINFRVQGQVEQLEWVPKSQASWSLVVDAS